jgi:tetratricopeptide (TPR) repeat protein
MPTVDELLVEAYSNWDDPQVLSRTGRELQNRNRLDHSRQVLHRAVELDPTGDADAWEYLAFAYYRDMKNDEGHEILRKAMEATGNDSVKTTLAGFSDDEEEKQRLREELAESTTPAVQAGLLWQQFHGGGAADALKELEGLHAAHPDDKDVRDTMIWMYLFARQRKAVEGLDLHEVALPLARAKVAEEPESMYGRTMAVWMMAIEEDWDAVLTGSAEALAVHPDDETMMQYRGQAWREKGDLPRAITCLNRAIGMKSSFVGARVDLGKIHESREEYDLAEEIFREIPGANPGYPAGPVSLALYLTRREQFDEAEQVILEAWPNLPVWVKGSLKSNPEAEALLSREAVKLVVGKEE